MAFSSDMGRFSGVKRGPTGLPGTAVRWQVMVVFTVILQAYPYCSREKPVFSSFFDEPFWHFCQFTDALFENTLSP